jgi:RNA polymerase sigma factor (sigma-70 family)
MWQGARLPDAADIAQDTMIKAYERWSEIRQPESWARRVASRELVRRIASVAEDPRDNPPEHSSLLPTLTSVEAWEQRHEVLSLLDRLPPRQRQVMAWSLDGYTPAEIADELEITSEAVRASLMKARRALVKYLGITGDQRE